MVKGITIDCLLSLNTAKKSLGQIKLKAYYNVAVTLVLIGFLHGLQLASYDLPIICQKSYHEHVSI